MSANEFNPFADSLFSALWENLCMSLSAKRELYGFPPDGENYRFSHRVQTLAAVHALFKPDAEV